MLERMTAVRMELASLKLGFVALLRYLGCMMVQQDCSKLPNMR
jgi:hypothetical protein